MGRAVWAHLARCRRVDAENLGARRRFRCASLTQQAVDLAGPKRDVDPRQRIERAEPLADAAHFEQRGERRDRRRTLGGVAHPSGVVISPELIFR